MLLSYAVFVIGCATAHSGKNLAKTYGSDGKLMNSKLIVSAKEINALASKHFGVVEFTFENKSNKFITIESLSVTFKNKQLDKNIKLIIGNKLQSWNEGQQNVSTLKAQNTAAVLGAISAAGAVASSSNHRKTRGAGNVAFFAGAGAMSISRAQNRKVAKKLSMAVPSSHLLSTPFSVAPGLFNNKWILLFTENPEKLPYVHTITVTYKDSNKKTKTLEVPFRYSKARRSVWQKNVQFRNIQSADM